MKAHNVNVNGQAVKPNTDTRWSSRQSTSGSTLPSPSTITTSPRADRRQSISTFRFVFAHLPVCTKTAQSPSALVVHTSLRKRNCLGGIQLRFVETCGTAMKNLLTTNMSSIRPEVLHSNCWQGCQYGHLEEEMRATNRMRLPTMTGRRVLRAQLRIWPDAQNCVNPDSLPAPHEHRPSLLLLQEPYDYHLDGVEHLVHVLHDHV